MASGSRLDLEDVFRPRRPMAGLRNLLERGVAVFYDLGLPAVLLLTILPRGYEHWSRRYPDGALFNKQKLPGTLLKLDSWSRATAEAARSGVPRSISWVESAFHSSWQSC